MNKKGFTVVELVVSFALTMVVVVMLLQVVSIVKTLYITNGIKTELLNKQAAMSKRINENLNTNTIKTAIRCGTGCINFIYEDNTSDKLVVDKNNSLFTFGNYTTKLISGSSFGNINVSNETFNNVDNGKNDSIITISVPIKHKLLGDNDYGVNVVYQYDSRTTSIADILLDEQNLNDQGTIVLKGSKSMLVNYNSTWVDPGYYIVTNDGSITEGPASGISGTVDTSSLTSQVITYSATVNGKTISTERTVTVIKNQIDFDYTGSHQIFYTPQTGTYKIELWGASGGTSSSSETGKGAYTSGTIALGKNSKLYVYVGQKGINGIRKTVSSNISPSNKVTFNGGGSGGNAGGPYTSSGTTNIYYNGASGGGATDVRLSYGSWNDFNSLKTRIMVASGGAGISSGHGGTINGMIGEPVSGYSSYAGTKATQISGNAFGIGGNGEDAPSQYCHGQAGGGGGYYGGGGAKASGGSCYMHPASGGSSYISGYPECNSISSESTSSNIIHLGLGTKHYSGLYFTNMTMINGASSMPSYSTTGNMTGNTGDGHARITLLSNTTSGTIYTGTISNSNNIYTYDGKKLPIKEQYGATWLRVFHHNSKSGTVLFTSDSEVLNSDTQNKQSILNKIDVFKGNDDKYEFLLEYPQISGYNRWKQSERPQDDNLADGNSDAKATGYEAISISWSGNDWGGLTLSTTPDSTYIDGSVGSGKWYYSIGAKKAYKNGIPAPDGSSLSGTVDLWIRIDDYLDK